MVFPKEALPESRCSPRKWCLDRGVPQGSSTWIGSVPSVSEAIGTAMLIKWRRCAIGSVGTVFIGTRGGAVVA